MKKTALIISYLFHPLTLPTYVFILLIWVNPYLFAGIPEGEKLKLVFMVFINTFIFPVLVVVLMKKLKFIDSFYLENQRERVLPYIAAMIFYFWSYIVFRKLQVPQILALALLGASITVFLSFFLNIFMKISMHTMGMGCMIGMVLIAAFISNHDLKITLFMAMFIAGIVGSARMKLESHTPMEIYTGYLLGFFSQMIALKFLF